MVYKECFVPSCSNNSENAPNKLFIQLPKDVNRRIKWFKAINVETILGRTHLHCCEDHFNLEEDAENWLFFKMMGNRLMLRTDVVPHLNIDTHNKICSPQLSDSAKKRKLQNIDNFNTQKAKRCVFVDDAGCSSSAPQEEPVIKEEVLDLQINANVIQKDQGIQVNIKKKSTGVLLSIQQQLNSNHRQHRQYDKKLGLQALESTDVIEQHSDSTPTKSADPSSSYILSTSSDSIYTSSLPTKKQNERLQSTIFVMETNSRFYLGLPPEVYSYVSHCSLYCLTSTRNILITLKEIRLDDVYERLSHDFELSCTSIQNIFIDTIPKLANVAQELIFWPDSISIKKTLPISFRAEYRDVQSIIDCLEIEIEKSSDPIIQAVTWSDYKKCNTLKYLISSTPGGFINYISGGYGGRTTDKEIVEKSGYLNVLPPRRRVMADRGFKHTSALLAKRNLDLVRPPSVSEGRQLTKQEAKVNKRIASLRVHIERVIRRIREFAMLRPHSKINNKLWYLMNHIIIIVCSIVNTQGRLVR